MLAQMQYAAMLIMGDPPPLVITPSYAINHFGGPAASGKLS